MSKSKIFVLFLLLFTLVSCGEKNVSEEKQKVLKVMVSIPPQAYIVREIGGEKVSVSVMLPPSSSPETYEPGPKRMAELKESALYFKIGVPFEAAFIDKLQKDYANVRFSEMQSGIELRDMSGADGHHHHHGEKDPHVWLDPLNLIKMAENCAAELSAADTENAGFYRANAEKLKAKINETYNDISNMLKDSNGKSFVIYHPAYGYFADRFSLKQLPLETEGKEPSASEMAKFTDLIKKNGVKSIFMQAQSPDSVVRSVAEETKVRVIVLDPLKEDVLENIRNTASEMKEALVEIK